MNGRMKIVHVVVVVIVMSVLTSFAESFVCGFDTDQIDQSPVGWDARGVWKVTVWGTNKVVENVDLKGVPSESSLGHVFSEPIDTSWVVDFKYDWQWGGGKPVAGEGVYDHVITMDMLDETANGYRVAVHQGILNGGAPGRLMEIRRIDAGNPTKLLAQGKGYSHAGWKSLTQDQPVLYPVRLKWDRGALTAFRYAGSAWEPVAKASDTNHIRFTQIKFEAFGWNDSETPELDDVTVTVGSPADTAPVANQDAQ